MKQKTIKDISIMIFGFACSYFLIPVTGWIGWLGIMALGAIALELTAYVASKGANQ